VPGDVQRRLLVSIGSGTPRRRELKLVNVPSWMVLEAKDLMLTQLPVDGTVNIMEILVAAVPIPHPLLAHIQLVAVADLCGQVQDLKDQVPHQEDQVPCLEVEAS